MELIKILILLVIFSLIPGQLIRIPIWGNAIITVSDLSIFLTSCSFLVYSLILKKSIKIKTNIVFPFTIFILIATASTLIAGNIYSWPELLEAYLFLVRFILYFALSIIIFNIIAFKEIHKWINSFLTISATFAILGIIQLVVFPDLTSLAAYGWDPHQRRIVATFLDPNFTGGFLTIAFSLSASLYLFLKKNIHLFLSILFFTTVVLTFSRSSYLAIFTSLAVVGILKSPKIFVAFLTCFIISFLTIGQVRSRIIGALTIDETSQARIESWQKAIHIFEKNPLIGVGFNTYRFAQEKYGFFSPDNPQGGHSGAGTDSSLLLIAATTGILGFCTFFGFILAITKTTLINVQNSPLKLAGSASLAGLLIHSQFVNSLFFPQIMIAIWFLFGLILVDDS